MSKEEMVKELVEKHKVVESKQEKAARRKSYWKNWRNAADSEAGEK